jgi:hypothetical protein
VRFLSGLDRALSSTSGDSVLIELPGSPAAIAGIIAVDESIMVLRWPISADNSMLGIPLADGQ